MVAIVYAMRERRAPSRRRARGHRRAARSASASAGSPRKPIPIEAIVIPSWQAERYSSIRSSCFSTGAGAAAALGRRAARCAGAAGADQRELGGDEEPVHQIRRNSKRRGRQRSSTPPRLNARREFDPQSGRARSGAVLEGGRRRSLATGQGYRKRMMAFSAERKRHGPPQDAASGRKKTVARWSGPLRELLDLLRELEVVLGEAALGVGRDRDLDLAPRDRRCRGGGSSPRRARRSSRRTRPSP